MGYGHKDKTWSLSGVMFAPMIAPPGQFPKMRVEIVPLTCWQSTVRSYLTDHYWRKLSREVADETGRRCEICGGRGRQHAVECHEVWAYDDNQHVQILLRLQALCPMCHYVKHLGRSFHLGYGEQACGRLARLNGWDAATTNWYVDAVFKQWEERSNHEWGLDLTTLGEVYEIPLHRLKLASYEISAAERRKMLHHREISAEDVYGRDGTRRNPNINGKDAA
jgi:hypothetical protein